MCSEKLQHKFYEFLKTQINPYFLLSYGDQHQGSIALVGSVNPPRIFIIYLFILRFLYISHRQRIHLPLYATRISVKYYIHGSNFRSNHALCDSYYNGCNVLFHTICRFCFCTTPIIICRFLYRLVECIQNLLTLIA